MPKLKSRLREIMKRQGRTQKWLSEETKTNKSTISSLMNEEHDPSSVVMLRIGKALGVPVEEIWWEEETSN